MAVVPAARESGGLQRVTVRIAALAVVALVAALVLGWPRLVTLAIALAGGTYAAELAFDDVPLDLSVPVIAAGLVLVAELAYWSLEERPRVPGDPGDGLRHAALVAALALGALVVGVALVALVEAVQTEGLALDVVGAIAASAILAAVLLAPRARARPPG